ncbi:hypothetical protein A2154_03700 [Candidatus Gottesmanbacteria bacterium RBG_16_43_7]|uniref:LytR/CpsA/Psr regulator C-terminal domain-containing protein n=1 Tax=Candidatus Gottesmanbacteria bacterium RBG_16_43_7 TaxID=1798373 RepID=A0A1F5Z935_9BACT|nr:MAG: hypothetical protein A2154_03700 [Candidatus Gottesmanbacteria bacterium RBG_16_43_7]
MPTSAKSSAKSKKSGTKTAIISSPSRKNLPNTLKPEKLPPPAEIVVDKLRSPSGDKTEPETATAETAVPDQDADISEKLQNFVAAKFSHPQADTLTPIPEIPEAKAPPISVEPEPAIPTKLERVNRRLYLFGGLVAGVIIGLVGILAYAYITQISEPKDQKSSESPLSVPSRVPMPAFVRMNISFEVLNGSGISGAAGRAADTLTEKGYDVISVGNADDVKLGAPLELYLIEVEESNREKILGDLVELFGEATYSGLLDTDSSASARIIIRGK